MLRQRENDLRLFLNVRNRNTKVSTKKKRIEGKESRANYIENCPVK